MSDDMIQPYSSAAGKHDHLRSMQEVAMNEAQFLDEFETGLYGYTYLEDE